MPFIDKQDRTEREEIKAKMRPEVIALVRDYARFLESEEWYVMQEVLRKSIEGIKIFSAGGSSRVRLRQAKQRQS